VRSEARGGGGRVQLRRQVDVGSATAAACAKSDNRKGCSMNRPLLRPCNTRRWARMVDRWAHTPTCIRLGRTFDQGLPRRVSFRLPVIDAVYVALGAGVFLFTGWLVSGVQPNILSVLGLAGFAVAGVAMGYRCDVELSLQGVAVTRRLGPIRITLRTPYAEFGGVLLQERKPLGDEDRPTIQVIELHHHRRSRCTPLYVARGTELPKDLWLEYSRRLKLPALRVSGGVVTSRAPDQLDLSLRERLRLQARDSANVREEEPPSGLRILPATDSDGVTRRIQIRKSRFPLWCYLVVLPMLALFLSMVSGEAWPIQLVAYAFSLAWIGIWVHDLRSHREFRVGAHSVEYLDSWPDLSYWGAAQSIEFDAIEDAVIGRARSNRQRALIIEGRKQRMFVGAGLGLGALRWLLTDLEVQLLRRPPTSA